MVVGDLPLSILVNVNETVSALDLVTSGTHGEFIDTRILAPVVSNGNVRLKDLTLRLLLEESDKVVLDERVVCPRHIRNGRQKNSLAGVTLSDSIGVLGGERRVPQLEKILHLLFRDFLRLACLGHHRRVVLADLPLSVLEDVDKGVPPLDLGAGGTHGEFIDTSILRPVRSDNDVTRLNLALGLQLEEVSEVVLNSGVVRAGNVRNSGEEDTLLGIAIGDLLRVECCQGWITVELVSWKVEMGCGKL